VLDPSNDAQVSLVEAESVEDFARDIGFPLQPHETRRNIVTRDVSLNDLVGMRFSVGEAELLGTEFAEPCRYLAKKLIERFALSDVTPKDIVAGLAHRAGLYAKILRGGTVRPGDAIVPLGEPE
jgi:MOSC domain-containing protein YiiM